MIMFVLCLDADRYVHLLPVYPPPPPAAAVSCMEPPVPDLKHPVPDLEHPVQNLEQPVSSLKAPMPSLDKSVSGMKTPESNLEHPEHSVPCQKSTDSSMELNETNSITKASSSASQKERLPITEFLI